MISKDLALRKKKKKTEARLCDLNIMTIREMGAEE